MAEKDPLVRCPNYKVCGSMVRESKAGNEHKYSVYDELKKDYVYKTCSG